MVELRLTAAAMNDLEDIRRHGLDTFGSVASDNFFKEFGGKFQLLREQPYAGQERPEFRRDMRSLPHRPYRILYEFHGDTVVIARIIHQSRDVRRALREQQ